MTRSFDIDADCSSQNSHKLGLAVSLEGAPEELEEVAQRQDTSNQAPIPF